MPKLNFGSSFDIHEGWVNLDRENHGQDVIADVLEGLPFEDDYFDAIVSNHSLQCIRFDDLPRALAELRRVLKPGGTLRILVPNADKAILKYVDGVDDFPISEDIESSPDGRFLRYLFWHGDARSAFTPLSLQHTLAKAGLLQPHLVDYGRTFSSYTEIVALDSREDESLIVEARK